MIDTTTNEPVRVLKYDSARPYIVVPELQLQQVTDVLDANKVSYWVDEEALSMDGGPEITFINLGYGTDPAAIQRLLDSIP